MDVTEQKATENELQKFRKAIEKAGHGIYITDRSGKIEFINPAFTDITGYTEVEAIGKTPKIMKSDYMPDAHFQALWETILAGDTWNEEIINRRRNGEIYFASQTIAPMRNENGDIESFIAIQMDVSHQKEMELKLMKFQKAIENAGHAIFITDRDGNIEFVNPAFEQITGYPEAEAIGQTPRILKSGKMTPEHYEKLWENLLTGKICVDEVINRRKNGDLYHASQTIAPMIDEKGDLTNFIAIQMDTSEQKAAESKILENETYIRAVIDNIIDGIITIDEKGIIQSLNPAAQKIFGYEADETIGQNVTLLMPESYRNNHGTYFENYMKTGKSKIIGSSREVEGLRKDGTAFPIDLAVSEMRIADKQLFTGIIRDITHRREAEKAIKESESRFRDLANLLPQTVWEIDAEGYFTFVNDEGFKTFGYTPNDLENGVSSIELFVPEDQERAMANALKMLNGEKVGPSEYQLIKKDKSTIPVLMFMSRLSRKARPSD